MTEYTRTKGYAEKAVLAPMKLEAPKWSTDASATDWTPGGYGVDKLESGVYKPVMPWDGAPYLKRTVFNTDSLIDLPDDPSSKILDHVEDFWDKEQAFRELNITYKRGIMLYGPPGSGKSATIYRLATMLASYNAIMILAQSADSAMLGIQLVKTLERDRKIVVILEDIDGMIRRSGDEDLTHLLDGGTDVDNVLFLATTNYPERIPPRILNRPSRFDVRIEIAMPSSAARRAYINHLVKQNLLVDIDTLVDYTDGMSIAEVKEIIILTQIFGDSIEEAIAKFRSLTTDSSDEDKEEDYREYTYCEVVETKD